MQNRIMVVTATAGFGELIQQTLVETGAYGVSVLTSAAEAIGLVQEHTYALAILDSDVEDFPFKDFIQALHKVAPAMHLVLIPPEKAAEDPAFMHPAVKGLLTKPFYLPDLLALMDKVFGSQPKPVISKSQTSYRSRETEPPEWVNDVSRAAQHLTGLMLGTAAQAALIVKDGQLWAYAGQLAQPAAQELASLVGNYWEQERDMPPKVQRGSTRSDLARFIRLGSTGGEYMLYATNLVGKMILALAFDAETPFSKIRSQTGQLARALAGSEPVTQPVRRNTLDHAVPLEPNLPPTRPGSQLRSGSVRAIPDLSEDWIKIEKLGNETFTGEEDDTNQELELNPGSEELDTRQSEKDTAVPSDGTLAGEAGTPMIVLEPVIPGMVNLVYACVIIPRLPQHHLEGDLVRKLIEWTGQLCLAFGWRLEKISVSPSNMQWIVNVSPSTSPSYLMRILRQHTSKRVFAEFPALAQDNPSGDFWAPGYLIMSSPTPPPESVIQEFIHQIRQHQGASNPFMPHFER